MAIETISDNGLSGNRVAKAWAELNMNGTFSIGDSFNIASISDDGVGLLTPTYTNAMASINYTLMGVGQGLANTGNVVPYGAAAGASVKTTTNCPLQVRSDAGGLFDTHVSFIIFGDQ